MREWLAWLVYFTLLAIGLLAAFYTPARRRVIANLQHAGIIPSTSSIKNSDIAVTDTPSSLDSSESLLSGISTPSADLTPTAVLPAPAPWDGKSRVTVLLLGLDYADWENTDRIGPPRSDTMILLTVDPVGMTAGRTTRWARC